MDYNKVSQDKLKRIAEVPIRASLVDVAHMADELIDLRNQIAVLHHQQFQKREQEKQE